MDGSLGPLLNTTLTLIIYTISHLIAVAVSAPVFILPGAVIGILGGILGQIYMKAQLSIKRERSKAKSPVLAEVNDAIAGVVSIRAFGQERIFTKQCADKVDNYSQVSIIFWNLNRWIAVRIQVKRYLHDEEYE